MDQHTQIYLWHSSLFIEENMTSVTKQNLAASCRAVWEDWSDRIEFSSGCSQGEGKVLLILTAREKEDAWRAGWNEL